MIIWFGYLVDVKIDEDLLRKMFPDVLLSQGYIGRRILLKGFKGNVSFRILYIVTYLIMHLSW